MFLTKKKISSVLLLTLVAFLLPITAVTTNAKTYLSMTDSVRKGELYTKMYGLTCSRPGVLIAEIKGKNLNVDLRVTIYGDHTSYGSSSSDLPTKVLHTNKKGDISGTLKTSHIMFKDRYVVKVQALSPAKHSGQVKINFYEEEYNIEDASYTDKSKDDYVSGARYIDLTDKKVRSFMLSGYREQKDESDYFKFSLHRPRYCAFRLYTKQNDGKVPYYVRILHYSDGKQIAKLGPITTKRCTKLLKLPATDYYLQVYTPDSNRLEGHQIVYSCRLIPSQRIDSIKLNHDQIKLYSINPYQCAQLKAKLTPTNKDKHTIEYKSNNHKVASVTNSGKITAHKAGKAVITCYAIDKPSVKAKCRVYVRYAHLTLSARRKKLYVGKTFQLRVKKTPKRQKVKWKSSNDRIVSVSSNGQVKAISSGKATIYAISDQGLKSKGCQITVKRKPKSKPKKPDDTTTEPDNKDDRTDKIAPVLSLSSAHLSPKGTITVTANVSGGTFSARGAISIKTKFGKSCVIRATATRGSGTILYQVNGKSASKSIVIY
jgi:hypothetical protein